MAARAGRGYNRTVAIPPDLPRWNVGGRRPVNTSMKTRFSLSLLLVLAFSVSLSAAEPLRIFIRGGVKTHPPGAHEHEQFLRDWTKLLTERGAKVDGAMDFPTAGQLSKTDVLILHSQEGGEIPKENRPGLETFLKRGGGLVVIHAASVPQKNSPDGAAYLKSIVGGAWTWGQTKWLEGPMSLYYVDRTHPITSEVGNYDLEDEIYYDMDLSPDARVLAAAYTPNTSSAKKNDQRGLPQKGKITVYDIAPQIWTYEKDNHARLCTSPAISTRTSPSRISARCCCAASRGPASARTWTNCARRPNSPRSAIPKAARRRPRICPRRSSCIRSSKCRSSPASRSLTR
jgi:type 1 glutamine amidotransferase